MSQFGQLNDRVLPFFEEHAILLLRVLTDRGTEYCGQREHHEYELYLAVENIDHSRTKARTAMLSNLADSLPDSTAKTLWVYAVNEREPAMFAKEIWAVLHAKRKAG